MNNKNMVDERFECISVIFRLAGNGEYNVGYNDINSPFKSGFEWNDYQREIVKTFRKFDGHEAVKYVQTLDIGFDAPFGFAMYIEKKGNEFVFIKDNDLLLNDDRWGDGKAKKFLTLLNKFYYDTNYAEFYNAHILYFEEVTQKFIAEYTIDFEWFGKYFGAENLQCILSPSNSDCNYGWKVGDKIICLVREKTGGTVVHEWCHALGNPLAKKWYEENLEFKKWCDDSVNIEKMPFYGSGLGMGNEYVTRSYDILYQVQHGANLEQCLEKEKNHTFKNSFPYIGEIYKMVLELEQDKANNYK